MRIAILCNDRLGLPALQQLMQHGLVVAAGTPLAESETIALVKNICSAAKVPFAQFSRQKLEEEIGEWLRLHKPDVVLVKTFPWKIPSSLLSLPKYGFINFHYAPLPHWRGSNPLFWMIRDGATKGGVTIHLMDERFDTGDILLAQEVMLQPGMSFGMLIGQLAYMGLSMTGPLLQGLLQGTLKRVPQNNSEAKWYGRPKQADLFINWQQMSHSQVIALVNACNPWNKGAGTRCNGWTFGITSASVSNVPVPPGTMPGTIMALDEINGMVLSCNDGTALRADIIYCEEGFFPGQKMALFDVRTGTVLS